MHEATEGKTDIVSNTLKNKRQNNKRTRNRQQEGRKALRENESDIEIATE